jgi:hypothetical protein
VKLHRACAGAPWIAKVTALPLIEMLILSPAGSRPVARTMPSALAFG